MGSSMSAGSAVENRPVNPEANQSLDRALECAIVVSWPELTPDTQTGLIHVEYGFAPTGTLDYLKVWSSKARGHWLLACEYWTSANRFHGTGVRFENGYESEGLAHIFEFVMQHQNSFVLPPNLGGQVLLQISTPTAEESAAAAALISEVFERLSSTFAKPAVA
jgi:hypothetical protein